MIPAFLLKNPLVSGLGVLALVLGIALGVQTLRVANRDVTIAQRDTALANMVAQQQANIAAAEAAVRKALQVDQENSNRIIAAYAAEIADLQEKANAAAVDIAAVPVSPVVPGCPDIMADPAVRAFIGGLPNDAPAASRGREAGPGPAPGAGRAGVPVPAPAR